MNRAAIQYVAKTLLLTLAYVGLARLGLHIEAVGGFAAPVWPPSGLALAIVLLLGFRFWPAIALGAVLVNLWVGATLPVALGIAMGNTLEALLAAYLMRRIPGFQPSLERLEDTLGLLVFAGLVGPTVSASVGILSLLLGGLLPHEVLEPAWRAWWLGDAVDAIIVAPLILTWRRPEDVAAPPERVAEATALGACLIAASWLIFETEQREMPFLLTPLMIWASIRFGQRGAARATFLVSAIAIWATVQGHGPLIRKTVSDSLLVLELYIALRSATFLVLGTLISERKQAEEKLTRSYALLHTLFDAAPVGLAFLDCELRYIRVNEAFAKINGLATHAVLGRHFREEPGTLGSIEPLLQHLLRTREPIGSRETGDTESVSTPPYRLINCYPVSTLDGRMLGVGVIVVDITDQKRQQKELEEAGRARDRALADLRSAEQRLRLAVQATQLGIWDFNLVAGKLSWDDRCKAIFGLAREAEPSYEAFLAGLHPDDRQRVRETVDRSLDPKSAGDYTIEYRTIGPTGIEQWSNSLGKVHFDKLGQPVRFIGTTRDITAQKRIEEELKRAIRGRDEFLAIASHELRTPLAALSIHLEMLANILQKSPIDDRDSRVREKVAKAIRQTDRLTRLIDGLLDVSRIATGRLRLSYEDFDFLEAVCTVVDGIRDEALRNGCIIRVRGEGPLRGRWDRLRVEQVLLNLLSNAIKYAPGTPIDITVEEQLRQIKLTVRDRGIGIAEEDVDRVFGRFERAVPARHYGGFGLGLYITRQAVEAHGGSIEVSSEEGAGSTFVVWLPVQPPAIAHAQDAEEHQDVWHH